MTLSNQAFVTMPFVYECVCGVVCVCVCVLYNVIYVLHASMWEHAPCVLEETVSSLIDFHCIVWDRAFHLTGSSLFGLVGLVSRLPGSAYLQHPNPNAGVTGMCSHTHIFIWVLGIWIWANSSYSLSHHSNPCHEQVGWRKRLSRLQEIRG